MAAPSWAELFFTGVVPVSKNFSASRIGVWGTLVCYPSRTEPLPKPIFGVKLLKRSFSHQQCHCSNLIRCVLLLQCTPCYVLLFNGYLAHPWDKTVWDPSEINSPSINIHWKFLWGWWKIYLGRIIGLCLREVRAKRPPDRRWENRQPLTGRCNLSLVLLNTGLRNTF